MDDEDRHAEHGHRSGERRGERILAALHGRDDREQENDDAAREPGERRESLPARHRDERDREDDRERRERWQPHDLLDRVLAGVPIAAGLRHEHAIARGEQPVRVQRVLATPLQRDVVPAVEAAVELQLEHLERLPG